MLKLDLLVEKGTSVRRPKTRVNVRCELWFAMPEGILGALGLVTVAYLLAVGM